MSQLIGLSTSSNFKSRNGMFLNVISSNELNFKSRDLSKEKSSITNTRFPRKAIIKLNKIRYFHTIKYI